MEARLYQECPRQKSTNPCCNDSRSFTSSRDSFRKASFKECLIHERNPRKPNQEIVLRYLVHFSNVVIKAIWKRLQRNLKRINIEFLAAIELTRGEDNRANNCGHYHFLFDTKMSREELMTAMKAVCLNSGIGVYGTDFDLVFPNGGITNWCEWKIRYFTKNSRWRTVYLFEKGLRIKKFYHSKGWFLDGDGNPTNKTKIRKQIEEEYKQMKAQEQAQMFSPVLQPHVSPLVRGCEAETSVRGNLVQNAVEANVEGSGAFRK